MSNGAEKPGSSTPLSLLHVPDQATKATPSATSRLWRAVVRGGSPWFFLLDRYGLINSILLQIGAITSPSLLANNMVAVIVVMVYCYLPFMLLPLYSSMGKITHDVIEASMDLGASWMQTFRSIIIPLSFSGIKTGFLLVLVPAFGEFAIPSLIGGSKNLFAGSLMTHYFLTMRDPARGSAFTIVSLIVLFVIVGLLYGAIKIFKKTQRSHREIYRGGIPRSLLLKSTIFVAFFLYIPITILIGYSFNKNAFTYEWQGFTFTVVSSIIFFIRSVGTR